MFSVVEAVLVHLRWVAGDVLSGTNAGSLLYNAALLGNGLACCGNWRSLRSKHPLPWWKMRRKSTNKKIYWYATRHRYKGHGLLLHWWATASNYLSVCETWSVTVRVFSDFTFRFKASYPAEYCMYSWWTGRGANFKTYIFLLMVKKYLSNVVKTM